MSYSISVELVQGDNLPGIQVTIRDRNTAINGGFLDERDPDTWAYVDLTGAHISAQIREVGGDTIIDTVPMTPINAVQGTVLLSLASTKFQEQAGQYELEATVTFDTAGRQTVYDWLRLNVRERF